MKRILFFSLLFLFLSLLADWTIVESFAIPEGASGLAYDGEYLYCGIYGANGDEIYQINPENGNYELIATGFLEDCFGLTFDGNYFWTIERLGAYEPSQAIQFSLTGEILSQVELPTTYMSGIAFDENNFWVAAYYDPDGQIYHLDSSGNILSEFAAPDNQPWDLCLESENLWMVDYWGDVIYKINPDTGEWIDSYESEGTDPAGIVFDNQYLWYCDNGSDGFDTLYKIDLGGSGTPAINLEPTSINFGNVSIGEAASLDVSISNSGTETLIISDFSSSESSFYLNTEIPLEILPDETVLLPIWFAPESWGNYHDIATLTSNDPVHPLTEVELSGYGLHAEAEIETSHNEIDFGEVRIGALTGRFFEISNQGLEELLISDMEVDSPFSFDSIDLPYSLAPRDTLLVRVWFQPEELINYENTLHLFSNDGDESDFEITVLGNSIEFDDEIGTELWQFQTNNEQEKVVAIHSFVDVTSDDVPELLVADNRYHLYCLNGNSSGEADIIWQFNSGIEEIGWGSVYDKRGITVADDLNEDGVPDVVIGTAWGSRTIFALNGANGEILWFYDTDAFGEGGWVYQVEAKRDFTWDSISDVLAVAGDDANGTGPKAVLLLDGTDGTLLQHKQFQHAQASVISLPTIDYDGTPEIVCGDSADGSEAKIHFLNSMFQELFDFQTNNLAVWALHEIEDITNDGFNDIGYGTFSGTIGTLTHEMNPIWSYSLGNVIITRLETIQQNGIEYLLPVINGGSNGKIYESESGNVVSILNANGNFLDLSFIDDLNGDGFFDVLSGTLANQLQIFSSDNGELIFSTSFTAPVDQVLAQADINQNQVAELVVGLRNGKVICFAGGTNSSHALSNVISAVRAGHIQSIAPNPFNPETKIVYHINKETKVELSIYNIKGQKIQTLVQNNKPKGTHQVVWQGDDLHGHRVGSGIYFVSLICNGEAQDKQKCMVIK